MSNSYLLWPKFIIAFFLYSTAFGQKTSHQVVLQEFRGGLLTEHFDTLWLRVNSTQNSKVYRYLKSGESYVLGKASFIEKYIGDSLTGFYTISKKSIDNNPLLGNVFAVNYSPLKQNEHKSKANAIQKRLDSLNGSTDSSLFRIYAIRNDNFMDGGVSTWWSEQYGFIYSKGFMSQSGSVIYSIDSIHIPLADRLRFLKR